MPQFVVKKHRPVWETTSVEVEAATPQAALEMAEEAIAAAENAGTADVDSGEPIAAMDSDIEVYDMEGQKLLSSLEQEDDERIIARAGVTDAMRARAATALGREVKDLELANAVAMYAGWVPADLRDELKEKEAIFAARGGRSIDLADEIDELRIALAVQGETGVPEG